MAQAETQTIALAQKVEWAKGNVQVETLTLNAAMVPKLVADLVCAAVALGVEMDWPNKPIQMQ